jgi:hypothetical protein
MLIYATWGCATLVFFFVVCYMHAWYLEAARRWKTALVHDSFVVIHRRFFNATCA